MSTSISHLGNNNIFIATHENATKTIIKHTIGGKKVGGGVRGQNSALRTPAE